MSYLDFSNIAAKNLKKLSVAVLPDSFSYAVFDDRDHIVYHQYFSGIRYNHENTRDKILSSMSSFSGIQDVSVTCMNDFSFQTDVRDDDILRLLPSTQHKESRLEWIPGSDVYNYFHLNPSQESLIQLLGHGDSMIIRDFVTVLALYYASIPGNILHVHIENQRVFIFAQSEGKVSFYKSFTYAQKEDVLYYALSGVTFFKGAPYFTRISGTLAKDSPLFALLLSFTEKAILVKDQDRFADKEDYHDDQFHYYFVHFATIV